MSFGVAHRSRMKQNGRISKESRIARMQHRTFRPRARFGAVFLTPGFATLAFGLAALAAGQTPPSRPSPAVNTPAAKNDFPVTNEDWLTQAGKLYYSSTAAGLKGFDCDVKPDWQ